MGKDWQNWLLIDKFIEGPRIVNWDIETLEKLPDGYLVEIFTSHALEHISHRKVLDVLKLWHRKLDKEHGKITIIVPDLMYAFRQLKAMENDQVPDGLYTQQIGLHSPLSIIYGTHSQDGEYHLGGFTEGILRRVLEDAGFQNIEINTQYEDHQMDSLIARATV